MSVSDLSQTQIRYLKMLYAREYGSLKRIQKKSTAQACEQLLRLSQFGALRELSRGNKAAIRACNELIPEREMRACLAAQP